MYLVKDVTTAAIVKCFIAVALVAGLLSVPIPARATDITTMPLGMHQATCPDGVTDGEIGVRCWEQILNRPIGSMYDVGDSVPWIGCWDSYDSGINPDWHPNTARQLVYNVGFFPDWYGCAGQQPTLSQAAANAYADHWKGVALDLVNKGYATVASPVIIRVAWEFDGSWYPWGWGGSGDDSGGNEATYDYYYVMAFEKLVTAFRRVSPNFKFVWNPTSQAKIHLNSYKAAYSGKYGGIGYSLKNYTNFVGLDVYDDPWDTTVDHQARWANEDLAPGCSPQNPSRGPLCEIAAMSASTGKPIVFPEWAAGEGSDAVGGSWPNDNPEFIANMAAFMADPTLSGKWPHATMGWQSYWSGDGYSGYCGWINTDINNCYGPQGYPRQRAAYIQKFKKP
jgi:hypothetical protein